MLADLKESGYQFRWLAHFSDPWSMNSYLPQNKLYLFLQERLEKRVSRYVDAVNVTAEQTKELLCKSNFYSKQQVYVTPHCYVSGLYPFNDSERLLIK